MLQKLTAAKTQNQKSNRKFPITPPAKETLLTT